MRASLLALALLAVTVTVLPAQSDPIAAGARVRYRLSRGDDRSTARVVERSADSLVVRRGDGTVERLGLATLQDLEVSRGRSHPRGAGKGALIGGGIAAAITAIAGGTSDEMDTDDIPGLVVVSALFGVIGAIPSSLVGFVVGSEGWTRVLVAPSRVSVTPAPRGVGVALSWRH